MAIDNKSHYIVDHRTSSPFRIRAFSPLLVRVHTGLFLELPPRASVDQKSKDIELLINLQLRGDLVGSRGKTQNEKDDHDL